MLSTLQRPPSGPFGSSR